MRPVDAADATYGQLMSRIAIQVQSTDTLAEELNRRLDGAPKSQLKEFCDADIIDELVSRMSSIGATLCRASMYKEMSVLSNFAYHTSTGSIDCYGDE